MAVFLMQTFSFLSLS